MNKIVLMVLLSVSLVAVVSAAIASEGKTPTIRFDKTSYSDTDTIQITVNGEITQSWYERNIYSKPTGILDVALGVRLSGSSGVVWPDADKFTCDKKLTCSNTFSKLNAGQFRDAKFYAKMTAKVDDVVQEFTSDAYTLGETRSTGPVSANVKPTVKISTDKASYAKGDTIKVTAVAEDKNSNLKKMWVIESYNGVWDTWKGYDCSSKQDKCEYTWEFTAGGEGQIYFDAIARDSEGLWSDHALTGFISISPLSSAATKLSAGLNTFIVDKNIIGKSVDKFDGYHVTCGPEIGLFKAVGWEKKQYNYVFQQSDITAGLVVYCREVSPITSTTTTSSGSTETTGGTACPSDQTVGGYRYSCRSADWCTSSNIGGTVDSTKTCPMGAACCKVAV